ncbi:AEC family transporter [Candidatus Woesearchaeota archaeon]|nr:AEC family transporter [Candidatus Woesearchaeota archaeon]
MDILLIVLAFIFGIIINHLFPKLLVVRKYLNKYLIYLGIPLVVFVSLSKTKDFAFFDYAKISFLIVFFMILFMFFLVGRFSIPAKDKASLFMSSTFGNCAYLGIPLSFLVWGDKGAIIASIFTIITMSFRLTIGLFLAQYYIHKKNTFKKVFERPFLWFLLIAVILSRFEITIPSIVQIIARAGTYIAVFVIGTSLYFPYINFRTLRLSLIKLILAPIIASVFLFTLKISDPWPFLVLIAMPPAFTNNALALEFKFNHKLTSSLTTVGTLAFMFIFLIFTVFYH